MPEFIKSAIIPKKLFKKGYQDSFAIKIYPEIEYRVKFNWISSDTGENREMVTLNNSSFMTVYLKKKKLFFLACTKNGQLLSSVPVFVSEESTIEKALRAEGYHVKFR